MDSVRFGLSYDKEDKVAQEFISFIKNKKAEILKPTNKYEYLRFKIDNKIGIIYLNRKSEIKSLVGQAKNLWEQFKKERKQQTCAQVQQGK